MSELMRGHAGVRALQPGALVADVGETTPIVENGDEMNAVQIVIGGVEALREGDDPRVIEQTIVIVGQRVAGLGAGQ